MTERLSDSETVISPQQRERLLGQCGCVVWLTGLSGAGKSTIARALEKRLFERGRLTYILDGDRIRAGLNSDLGFSPDERSENVRRVREAAALFAEAGVIAVVSLISPYRSDRDLARTRIRDGRFFEVFVDAPLEICERRDPKGLYRKARTKSLQDFTGISAPYEAPLAPDLVLRTAEMDLDECADAVVELLSRRGMLSSPSDQES